MDAAGALLAEGRTPSVDEVAERARVSRATAYRYFPSQDVLLLEAVVGAMADTPERLFPDAGPGDPEEAAGRASRAALSFFELAARHPTEFRNFLRLCLEESHDTDAARRAPGRQGRRLAAFEPALFPVAERLGARRLARLTHALAMCSGVEAMVVLEDVCGLSRREGRAVVDWAARALVREALAESAADRGSAR